MSETQKPLEGDKRQALVQAFKEAKDRILIQFIPNIPEDKKDSTFDLFNEAAYRFAIHNYGDLIDNVINELDDSGCVDEILLGVMQLTIRNTPDSPFGEGRVEEYHKRFKAEISPLMLETPIRRITSAGNHLGSVLIK